MTGKTESVRVCIIDPTDPCGATPGGVTAFIQQILKCRPDDIEIELIGITTDKHSRPVKQWTECAFGNREFRQYSVLAYDSLEEQPLIPASLLFTVSMMLKKPQLAANVLDFHRIEPIIAWRKDARPKSAVIHQNPMAMHSPQSSVRWRHLPGAFDALENRLLPQLDSVYTVREAAVLEYQNRIPGMQGKVHYLPTMYDSEIFVCPHAAEREQLRSEIRDELGLSRESRLLVTVGRLEAEKDPQLLLDSFRQLEGDDISLVYVGDGRLRSQIEKNAERCGIADRVRITGVQNPTQVSRILAAADTFALTSIYEGRPIAVLEALATGLPVATTAVGEVGDIVTNGVNGEVCAERSAHALGQSINNCLELSAKTIGTPRITATVAQYGPTQVLAPLYQNYRNLAAA